MTDNMDLLLNSAKYTAVASSILDNGIVSETISIVITAAIPIIILALIVYFIRIGNKKKQNQLIKEELELKKKRGL
jgi:Na+/H+ antiporter NhaC